MKLLHIEVTTQNLKLLHTIRMSNKNNARFGVGGRPRAVEFGDDRGELLALENEHYYTTKLT